MSDSGYYFAATRGPGFEEVLLTTAQARKARAARRSKYVAFRPARLHTCSVCGKQDAWKPGWVWFGSIEREDGGEGVEATYCPDHAPENAVFEEDNQ